MKTLLPWLGCLPALFAVSALAGAWREESVLIFENRKIAVTVPAGFAVTTERDEAGLGHVQLADRGKKTSLDLVFVPDPEGDTLRTRGRMEKMVGLFDRYVAGAVERAMQFEELEPRRGAGTYCVFTDASLVGRADLPPNEYRHLTVGIKAWPGVMTIIRLFSQDRTSPEYQALLRVLRESVEERPVPLR